MKESIIEKVRNLLNKNEANGCTEAESQSAMLMAQKLMAKHGLDMADVDTEGEESKEVVHEGVTPIEKTIWWKKSLANVVAENFKCICYISTYRGRGGSKIVFLGLKSDVEIAKEVFNFAVDSIVYHTEKYARKKMRSEGYTDTRGLRNDFMKGYIRGLRDKFEEQKKQCEELALALVIDKEVQEEAENMNFKKGRRSDVSSSGNQQAISSGYNQGKQFDYSRKQIK